MKIMVEFVETRMRDDHHAEGNFWIDQEACVACQACTGEAPANIRFDAAAGKSYVFKQPETAAEIHALQEAVILCPVEAARED